MSGTHCNPLAVKTDAPWDVIWDIMRAWVADHPVKPQVHLTRCSPPPPPFQQLEQAAVGNYGS